MNHQETQISSELGSIPLEGLGKDKIIQVEKLTKKFGDFTAVKGITFDVFKGEIFGFLGANGAGKTTAMKMLIGISSPTSGSAIVAGLDVATQADLVKKNIGYMSQKFSLYDDLTIKENITFFGGIYGLSRKKIKEKTQQLIAELEMQNVADNLVGSLPLGWKQKLSFSVALLHEPKIVFLDEPTGGVDPITRRQFWEMIYTQAYKGTTIFVTTHYMDEAEYCDRVSIMVDGVIEALDTPKNLKQQFNVDSMNDVFLKLARNIE
jgi:ABC-2 type transport system ATP-binding protein